MCCYSRLKGLSLTRALCQGLADQGILPISGSRMSSQLVITWQTICIFTPDKGSFGKVVIWRDYSRVEERRLD